jgi:hypothetical protein
LLLPETTLAATRETVNSLLIIDLPQNASRLKSTIVTVEANAEVRYPSQSVVTRGDIDL